MARPGRPAKKNNTMSEDSFFSLLSKKVNYLPENIVRDVYFSIVQIIKEEFRGGNGLFLPDFGGLSLVQHKAKHGRAPKVGQVYFKTSESLKDYIKALSEY